MPDEASWDAYSSGLFLQLQFKNLRTNSTERFGPMKGDADPSLASSLRFFRQLHTILEILAYQASPLIAAWLSEMRAISRLLNFRSRLNWQHIPIAWTSAWNMERKFPGDPLHLRRRLDSKKSAPIPALILDASVHHFTAGSLKTPDSWSISGQQPWQKVLLPLLIVEHGRMAL